LSKHQNKKTQENHGDTAPCIVDHFVGQRRPAKVEGLEEIWHTSAWQTQFCKPEIHL